MVASARATGSGVPVEDLRAAVGLARFESTGGGVVWPPAVWELLWVRLTPLQQGVVYHRVLVGLTFPEIASLFAISRGSVDAAWRRALDRIRDAVPPP